MAKKTLCSLFNEFEAERNAALMNAAIDKEIEDIEFEIYLYESALRLLNVDNIEDIKLVDSEKFIVVFKDDIGLHQLLGMETPEGVEIYGTESGFRLAITDKCSERLDEHFGALIDCVKTVIKDSYDTIEELVGKKTS